MANLTVENLNKVIQMGDVEGLMTGNSVKAPEAPTVKEMQHNGMEIPSTSDAGGPETFSKMLRESVDKVNTMQVQADTAVKELVSGRSKNIHETMLTIERADTSLKLMMQVRNKILDAYREIMRMQV